MPDLFNGLGRKAASTLAKAKWTFAALTGTEKEALAAERELGAHMAKGYLEEVPLAVDSELQGLVQKTGVKLADWVSNSSREFHFACVDLPESNAVALPGGYVFLSVGLVEYCRRNSDMIAGLLAHEIGHVVKNHAFERATASKLMELFSRGAALGGPLKRAAMGMVANLLSKGYSEDQEFEADVFGVRLAHTAGFHASGLMRFLKGLSKEGDEISECPFLASHPQSKDRITNLRETIG